MTDNDFPELSFEYPFDELAQIEAKTRGFLSDATVRLPDGTRYPLFFYDPIRLSQELKSESETGRMCVAEPGMIVVPEVTLDNMQKAVGRLWREGFFNSLKSLV